MDMHIPDTKPKKVITFEPTARRIRVEFNGTVVADSSRAMLMRETGHMPTYYLPLADMRLDLMPETDHTTHCPYKGDAHYRSVTVDGRTAENALWYYPAPLSGTADLRGYGAFYWDRMDRWFEEDEEIFRHPRDPYKRVDAIQSSRRVQVVLDGATVADTTRAVFVFETGLPTRYYMPAADVTGATLTPTETKSVCPYKGTAAYYAVTVGGKTVPDLVWTYPEPIPEIAKIAGLVAFYNEKVDAILLDGVEVPKTRTPWS